jgi:predicted lipid carrier protein YhbT
MALLAYCDPQLLLRVRSLRLWRVESMDVSGEAAIIKLLAVIVRVKDCDWVLFERA